MAITKRTCGVLVLAGLVGAGASDDVAIGAVRLVSQEREISAAASAGGPGAGEEVVWTQLGYFSDSVSVSYDTGEPYPNTAYATQTSMIGPDYFWMTGEVGGEDRYGSGGAGDGIGRSSVEIIFAVDEVTPVVIHVSRTFSGSAESASVIVFNAADVEVIRLSDFGSSGAMYSGNLAPGQYRVFAGFADGASGSGTGTGRSIYSMSMSIPAAGTGAVLLMPLVLAGRRRRR